MRKVFINSLPKSGTNLLVKTLDLFGFKQSTTHIGAAPFVNRRMLNKLLKILYRPYGQGYLVGVDMPVEMNKWIIHRKLKKTNEGQYLIGHVGYTESLLSKIKEMNFATIQVIRDPRGVIASWVPFALKFKWHAFHKVFNKMTTEQRYRTALDGYISNHQLLASMYTRCMSLESWVNSKDTLLIKFEDIVGSQGGGDAKVQKETLEKICTEIDAPIEKIDYVIENLFGPGRFTFRKGSIDAWKEEIPSSLHNEMKEKLEPILIKWGYES